MFPTSRLQAFENDVDAGKILVMVDVIRDQLKEVTDMIQLLDPDISIEGIEPPAPPMLRLSNGARWLFSAAAILK